MHYGAAEATFAPASGAAILRILLQVLVSIYDYTYIYVMKTKGKKSIELVKM
jgi:hypothetical protein